MRPTAKDVMLSHSIDPCGTRPPLAATVARLLRRWLDAVRRR